MKIAVGGMQHETNTFAPTRADLDAFVKGGGWPTIQYGDSLFDAVAGANLPVAGAIDALRAASHQVVPLAWAAASPSAHVTREAFETIIGSLIERLQEAMPVDGVYLDLHGAMVCEHIDDGEGEILARVRQVVGPKVPVVASLDLHANVTRRMVQMADALTIYRTYPHVDMARHRRAGGAAPDDDRDERPAFRPRPSTSSTTSRRCRRSARSWSPPGASTNCWPGSSASTTSGSISRPAFRWRISRSAR